MRVLVTGSEGLIGRPLCRTLEARGDEVVHFDKALSEKHDIMNLHTFDGLFYRDDDQGGEYWLSLDLVDAVIHLAAQSGVEQSRASGYDAWQLNFVGTLNVLEACRLHDKPVVIASSNHIYGDHGGKPTKEDAPQLQLDTYSATKHAADLAARSYAHNYGLRVVEVRNTNCFGPDDPHDDHIVPTTILSVLEGKRPELWSDGGRVKSYLYVDDVAEAYIAATDWLVNGGESTAFNVSGERISALDLSTLICEVMGTDLRPIVHGKPSDQADENLDDSKFRTATGWAPSHSLREAVAKTVDGFRARAKGAVSPPPESAALAREAR